MSGRQIRSFRYGPRLKITAPLGLVFLIAAAEMWLLANAASHAWQVLFVAAGALTSLLAIAMIREAVVRLRGKRRVVVGLRELVVPTDGKRRRDVMIPFRDLRALELTGAPGFGRILRVRHTGGEVAIAGVMLGSVGELDEIHGLLKAARKSG